MHLRIFIYCELFSVFSTCNSSATIIDFKRSLKANEASPFALPPSNVVVLINQYHHLHSYMQLMALSRFTMILSRKLHRFGTKLIAPDETYTSKTCLSCRIVKPRSADRTFKCNDCKLHTHRDITSSSNIAIRSIGLGEMALHGIMVA